MEPAAVGPRSNKALPESDFGLLPRGLRRLAIALYLAAGACVAVVLGLEQFRYPSWIAAWIGLVLVAYCLGFALGLWRARQAWDPPRVDLRPYALAFGDDAPSDVPALAQRRRDVFVLMPFVIHAACGLLAGAELVLLQARRRGWADAPLNGYGLLAGLICLGLGWMPAIALVLDVRRAGWALLAGVLGPVLILAPFLLR